MLMKHLFIDMDGTINSWVNNNGGVVINNFDEPGLFINKRPVYIVIIAILELYPVSEYEYHILSASPNKNSNNEKDIWLDKYFPISKKERYYLPFPGENKTLFIKNYCTLNNIKCNNCTLIDDTHNHLLDAEKNGINAIHPATIISYYEELKNQNNDVKQLIKKIIGGK